MYANLFGYGYISLATVLTAGHLLRLRLVVQTRNIHLRAYMWHLQLENYTLLGRCMITEAYEIRTEAEIYRQ